MVLEGIVDVVVAMVLVIGLPVLVVLFFLEGLVVGKLLQPPAVFVAVVGITRPSIPVLAILCLACTASVVAGQWTLFRSVDDEAPELLGIRQRFPRLRELPARAIERIGERRLALVDRLFARFGAAAIVVTTFLPGIRGLLAVPAGVSAYPTGRFLVATTVGNVLYFPVLVAVAFGIVRLLGGS